MANTVRVDIVVDDNGTLKLVSRQADQAAGGLDRVSRSAQTADRNLKGAAQASANGTKNFSKMAQGMGGLVGIYATFAATSFAVTAALNILEKNKALQLLEQSLVVLGASSGIYLPQVAKDLQAVTGFAVSSEQALRATSIATSAGFSVEQLTRLTSVATGAATALGRNLPDALDRLVRGTAKLEPEILDELGIIVRLNDATAAYAAQIGKSVGELTAFDKQQAFLNATLEQGEKKYSAINKQIEANPYAQITSSFNDLVKIGISLLNTVLEPLVTFFATSKLGLTSALILFGNTLVKQITPAISDSINQSAASYRQLAIQAKATARQSSAEFNDLASRMNKLNFAPQGFKDVEDRLKSGEATAEEYNKAIKSLSRSIQARQRHVTEGTSANIEQITEELEQVKELKKQVEALRDAQQRSTGAAGAGPQADRARAASRAARRQSVALQAMEGRGLIDQFRIASRTTNRYYRDAINATTVTEGLRRGFTGLTNSVGLFGRVALTAIPIVGQIIGALSIVIPLIRKFFGKEETEYDKAFKDAEEGIGQLTKVLRSLKEQLDDTDNANDIFFTGLQAAPGVLQGVISSIEALTAAKKADRLETLESKRADLASARSRVATIEARLARGAETPLYSTNIQGPSQKELDEKALKQANQAFTRAFEEVRALEATPLDIPLQDMRNTVQKALDTINISGDLGPGMATAVVALQDLLNTGRSLEDFTKGLKELKITEQQLKSLGTSTIAAEEAFGTYLSTIDKLSDNKLSTTYTNSLDALKSSTNEFLQVLEAAGQNDVLKESLGAFEKNNKDLANFLSKSLNKPFQELTVEGVRNFIAGLEKSDNTLANMGETIKQLEKDLKDASAVSGESAFFAQKELDARTALLNAKLEQINLEESLLEKLKDEKLTVEEINRFDERRATVMRDSLEDAERRLITVKGEQAEKKALLDLQQKQLQYSNQISAAEEQIAKNRAERSEMQVMNTPFGFLNEEKRVLESKIALEESLLASKIQAIKDEEKIKKGLVDVEYTLLKEQLEVLKEKKIAAGEDPTRIQTLIDRTAQNQVLAEQGIEAGSGLSIDNLNLSLEKLKDAKSDLTDIRVLTDGVAQSLESNMSSAFMSLIDGTKTAKQAFGDMAVAILKDIAQMITRMLVMRLLLSAFGGGLGGVPTNVTPTAMTGTAASGFSVGDFFASNPLGKRYGGVTQPPPGYATGGIARGSDAGYPAVLHGTEAVVPLPNNRSIPVDLKGAGQSNNVTVNVSVANDGKGSQDSQASSNQGANLGAAIAAAVQKELQNQKRSGGILNPYGVA